MNEFTCHALVVGSVAEKPRKDITRTSARECVKLALQCEGTRVFGLVLAPEMIDAAMSLEPGDIISITGSLSVTARMFRDAPIPSVSILIEKLLPLNERERAKKTSGAVG